jgi:rRNA-processing protein EBP2
MLTTCLILERQEGAGNVGTHEADDLFDVAVDNELGGGKRRRTAGHGKGGDHVPNAKRQKKNEKYGFGGKKRHSKSGDAISSGDLSGFSVGKNRTRFKGKAAGGQVQRPGKARRKAMASRH